MKKNRLLLLLPCVAALASCGGYALDYIVEGDRYLSADFNKNYYEHWDDELKNAPTVLSFDDNSPINYINKFSDIGQVDEVLSVSNPYASMSDPITKYGGDYKLNNLDSSFNYGVQSKLFDGIMFCRKRYQRVRVQARHGGFSVRFSKESDEMSYFAMHFKATTNNQIDCYDEDGNYAHTQKQKDDLQHNSEFDLTVSIYFKNDSNNIVKCDVTKHMVFDNNTTNDGSEPNYRFFAFKCKEMKVSEESQEKYTLSRVVGFSVNIDNIQDSLITYNNVNHPEIDLVTNRDYALFIYEVFMPYTYWH